MLTLLTVETIFYCVVLLALPVGFATVSKRKIDFSMLTNFVFFGALTISIVMLTNQLTNMNSWEMLGSSLSTILGIALFGMALKLTDASFSIIKSQHH